MSKAVRPANQIVLNTLQRNQFVLPKVQASDIIREILNEIKLK